MSKSTKSPSYPADLKECKCGKFVCSGKRAFSAAQKKFYLVCDNCMGICDEDFLYDKMREAGGSGSKTFTVD